MSKTRKKNLLCLIFAAICCLFAGILFGSTTKVSAAEPIEPKTFEMVSGASIRIGEGQVNGKEMTNGLRFQVKMDETTAKSINGETKKLYVLIAPVAIVDLTIDEQITANSSAIVSHKAKWISVAADSIYESVDENGKNYYFANAMICNLTSDFYGVKFNAIAIIENGGEYTYAKAVSTSRSLYDVVNSAVLDKYADRIFGDSVAENKKLDYAKWYGTAEYPVAPQTPAQFNKYNELKSTTLKNLSIERQDVMVNNPVVTIGGKEYPITVPEVHGEQDVEVTVEGATVTVPVTIITKEIKTFDELMQSVTARNNEVEKKGAYYTLGNDIDAEGKTIYTFLGENGSTITPEYCDLGKGFAGTLNGKGYKVSNLNLDSSGIFRGMTGATVKNISFEIANYSEKTTGAALFASNVQDCLFEKVTVTVTKAIDMETNDNSGLLVAQQTKGTTFKSVNIIADDSTLTTLVGSGYWSGTAGNNKYENCAVSCLKLNYVGNTIATIDGMDVKTTKTITLTNNQDILLTNETYAISLGSEGAGLTINSITCNGVDLGTNLSNLDMSAIKRDMTKHGITNVIVKGEKDGNKVTIIAPVTIITKQLKSGAEFKEATYCANPSEGEKNKGAYYILVHNLDVSDTSFTASDDNWINLGEAGFAGTIDGRGHKLANVSLNDSLGIFKSLKNATIKNLEIEVASLNVSQKFASVFASYADSTVFENITITLTTPIVTTECGLLGGGNQSINCTFKDITVNAQGSDIHYLFSNGNYIKDSKNNIRRVTVNAKSVQYMYATTDLKTSGFDVTVNLDENQ